MCANMDNLVNQCTSVATHTQNLRTFQHTRFHGGDCWNTNFPAYEILKNYGWSFPNNLCDCLNIRVMRFLIQVDYTCNQSVQPSSMTTLQPRSFNFHATSKSKIDQRDGWRQPQIIELKSSHNIFRIHHAIEKCQVNTLCAHCTVILTLVI